MEIEANYTISAEHSCLPGHFPGSPIIPAVLLLDMVQNCLQELLPDAVISELSRAKFSRPLKPDTPVKVMLTLTRQQGRFSLQNNLDQEFASGSFTFRPSIQESADG